MTLVFPSGNVSFLLNVLHYEVKMPSKKWVDDDSGKYQAQGRQEGQEGWVIM